MKQLIFGSNTDQFPTNIGNNQLLLMKAIGYILGPYQVHINNILNKLAISMTYIGGFTKGYTLNLVDQGSMYNKGGLLC